MNCAEWWTSSVIFCHVNQSSVIRLTFTHIGLFFKVLPDYAFLLRPQSCLIKLDILIKTNTAMHTLAFTATKQIKYKVVVVVNRKSEKFETKMTKIRNWKGEYVNQKIKNWNVKMIKNRHANNSSNSFSIHFYSSFS